MRIIATLIALAVLASSAQAQLEVRPNTSPEQERRQLIDYTPSQAVGLRFGLPSQLSYYFGSPILFGNDFRVNLATNFSTFNISAEAIVPFSTINMDNANDFLIYGALGPSAGFGKVADVNVFSIGLNLLAGLEYRFNTNFAFIAEAGPSLGYALVTNGKEGASGGGIGITGGIGLKYYF